MLALLELGLLLPFVHLGDWITRPGIQLIEGRHSLLKGKHKELAKVCDWIAVLGIWLRLRSAARPR